MTKRQKRMWKRANRRFNKAFAKAQRLSEKQRVLIDVMQTANDELHCINEELKQDDQ